MSISMSKDGARHIAKWARIICAFALDIVAPPDPTIRSIERMESADFLTATRGFSAAIAGPPVMMKDGIAFLLPYRHALVKAAVIEIKERENRAIARLLGTIFSEALPHIAPRQEMAHGAEEAIVIPIPITRKRRRERGWNQCELILDHMEREPDKRSAGAKKTGRFKVRKDILVKIRETEDQVGKSRDERKQNLGGCFVVNYPGAIRGRTAIILDDILTTGSTLSEARRTLESAGAARVICVAIAH